MAWRVGQKIVCVNRSPQWDLHPYLLTPLVGKIYTILELCFWEIIDEHHQQPCFILVELPKRPYKLGDPYHDTGMYLRSRFRPLVDISVFDKILDKVNNKESINVG